LCSYIVTKFSNIKKFFYRRTDDLGRRFEIAKWIMIFHIRTL
jgi:hypothetical protein